jgi:hypothetical protein
MLMRSLQQLGDEIAELSVHLDAATVRLLDLIREFDIREGWNNGFRSCAAWLAWRVGLDIGAARERVSVARALEDLPRLKTALAHGELSYAKVRALTRVARPETEERLLAVGRAGTAEHVERIVRGWRHVDPKAEIEETRQRHKHRALHVYRDVDGSVVIRGRLAPEAGAVLIQALTAAGDVLRAKPPLLEPNPALAETRSFEQQQADALVLVAETALHHGIDPGTRPSAIRWWSTSTPTCWLTRTPPASQSSKEAHAFPRKRPSASRAMRAGWRCATTPTASSWRSARELERSRRRCAARSPSVTTGAGSRAVISPLGRLITSNTGPGAARPRSPTSSCCVAVTTAPFTKKAFGSSEETMTAFSSAGPTVTCCRRSHRLPRRQGTWRQQFEPGIRRRG